MSRFHASCACCDRFLDFDDPIDVGVLARGQHSGKDISKKILIVRCNACNTTVRLGPGVGQPLHIMMVDYLMFLRAHYPECGIQESGMYHFDDHHGNAFDAKDAAVGLAAALHRFRSLQNVLLTCNVCGEAIEIGRLECPDPILGAVRLDLFDQKHQLMHRSTGEN